MSLLAMLKKGKAGRLATATVATVATDRANSLPSVAAVATVNVAVSVNLATIDLEPSAAKVQPVFGESGNNLVDIGTVRPTGLSHTLLAASLALDASINAAGTLPGNGPDNDCWPRSTAMNGEEINLFTARLRRFNEKGLTRTDGEALADRLVIRDRETDDRRFCLECRHLSGFGHTSWRCGNWQAAGVAIRPRDTQLPVDLVLQLQRCDGFATATPNARTNAAPNPAPKTPL